MAEVGYAIEEWMRTSEHEASTREGYRDQLVRRCGMSRDKATSYTRSTGCTAIRAIWRRNTVFSYRKPSSVASLAQISPHSTAVKLGKQDETVQDRAVGHPTILTSALSDYGQTASTGSCCGRESTIESPSMPSLMSLVVQGGAASATFWSVSRIYIAGWAATF